MDQQRLRFTFGKGGALVYTSHLDLLRVWERSLRRAGLPLSYSRGFNPRPKLQLAAALPLGTTGAAEILDVWLERRLPLGDVLRALLPVLAPGLSVSEVLDIPLDEQALQPRITSAEYGVAVEWDASAETVRAAIECLLAAPELPSARRGQHYDLRPLIEALWLECADGSEVRLGMRLAARASATARPEAVLEALGVGQAAVRFDRRRLIW